MPEKGLTIINEQLVSFTVNGQTHSLEDFVSKLAVIMGVLGGEYNSSTEKEERAPFSYPVLRGMYETLCEVYYPLAEYVYADDEAVAKYL